MFRFFCLINLRLTVFGSVILIDTDQPAYGISLPLILVLAVATALLLVIVVGMALKSRTRPVAMIMLG